MHLKVEFLQILSIFCIKTQKLYIYFTSNNVTTFQKSLKPVAALGEQEFIKVLSIKSKRNEKKSVICPIFHLFNVFKFTKLMKSSLSVCTHVALFSRVLKTLRLARARRIHQGVQDFKQEKRGKV